MEVGSVFTLPNWNSSDKELNFQKWLCYCHSQTWLWLWPSDGLEPTHHPTPPQTFNCQYLSHFSTNWAEIFFGNPPVGNSNVKTTKNFKLQVGASIASFVGHCQYFSHFSTIWAEFFFGNTPVGNSNVKTTKNFKHQLGASIASFVGHCQYLSHFSTNWAEMFFGDPPVGNTNVKTTKILSSRQELL